MLDCVGPSGVMVSCGAPVYNNTGGTGQKPTTTNNGGSGTSGRQGNSGGGSSRQPNAYCHNNPNALSCHPSRPSVAVVIGPQLIVAPSQAQLDAAIGEEFQCPDNEWDGPGGCAGVANSPGIAPGIAAGICAKNPAWCTLQDLTMAAITTGAGGVGWGEFGKNGKPPHTAVVHILDANGQPIAQHTLKSGGMTPQQRALGFPRAQLDTHTEAKAMRLPEIQRGQHIVIDGQYAPCPSCRGKMRQTAMTRNVTIAYRWEGRVWVAAPYGAGHKYRTMINRAVTRGTK